MSALTANLDQVKILELILGYCERHNIVVVSDSPPHFFDVNLQIVDAQSHKNNILRIFPENAVKHKLPSMICFPEYSINLTFLEAATLAGHKILTFPKSKTSRTLTTPLVSNIQDLIDCVESFSTPFIIRNTDLLNCSFQDFSKLADQQTTLLKGYSSSLTWDFAELSARDVLEKWQSGTLAENIVDAPVDAQESVMPKEMQIYLKEKLGEKYTHALCWIFTVAPKVTHFHTDPIYAGGWMKLLEGEKIWWLVAPKDYHYLVERGHSVESMAKLEFSEMLELENGYLQDKIYSDIIRAGDLLWFPIYTLHKVITTKSSYGFGGYF